MTDKAPPKGKKGAKEKATKKAGPKPKLDTSKLHGIGHNRGEKHPEVIKCIDELMHFQEQKKAIAKAERDVRNRLKTEFGILSTSVAREVAMRKLDPDVRVQVEMNHEDLKEMLGYQPSLDFAGGEPTKASVKAQPKEADLTKKTDPSPEEQKFEVEGEAEADEVPPIPDALKRPVIEREG